MSRESSVFSCQLSEEESGSVRKRSLLQIDIEGILKKRIPKKNEKYIPNILYKFLARFIHQNELNEMLRAGFPSTGSEFAHKVLKYLNISVEVEGKENLPPLGQRTVFACNHPLGGLDGIALIDVLGSHYGDENIRFMVNDLLMNVEPLRNVFIPINKYGSQARDSVDIINREYASDREMVVFPAGLVSRLQDDGEVEDLTWQKAFVVKAFEYNRDIVPVRFVALNRKRFYRFARWRKKLGIKVNLEQATLPAELCAARGKRFKVIIGTPVKIRELRASKMPHIRAAAYIRDLVYSLRRPEKI